MGTMTRILVLSVALILAFPIPGSGQNYDRQVEVFGSLLVYDKTGQICSPIRASAVLSFVSDSPNLSFDGQTTRFDPYCQWLGKGTLHQGEASLEINAQIDGFVQYMPNEPIKIRATDPKNSLIRRKGIRVILYERERFSYEFRALAHEALKANNVSRAIELYDAAFKNLSDPETLYFKADALDRAGQHAAAASTWSQAIQLVSDDPAVRWTRASDVPERWATSLYRDAKTKSEPKPEIWLNVAKVSRTALNLQSPKPTRKSMIRAIWLDSLFNAATARGDYSRLSKEILSDQNMQNNWLALFYEEFKAESRPDSLSDTSIVLNIGELEAALGRKDGQHDSKTPRLD